METILVVSGVNETGMLRTMSWHGNDSFGVRVMDAVQLAQYALVREGRILRERPVDACGRRSMMLRVLENDPAGTAGFSTDYSDLGQLLAALDRLRMLIPENESHELKSRLVRGEFKDKNEALLAAYDGYTALCRENGAIDRIGIIRYAAENCGAMKDVKLMTLEEYPPEPLEKKLLEVLGGSGTTSLEKLYKAEGRQRRAEADVFKAYGASNEALKVIETILSEKISFDRCIVAAADTHLTPAILLELGQRYGIKMTFGCGVPMSCTPAADMLSGLLRWISSGFGGGELLEMIRSVGFNTSGLKKVIAEKCGIGENEVKLKKAAGIAGKLRLGTDIEVNRQRMQDCDDPLVEEKDREEYEKAFRQAEVLAEELGKGSVYLLKKYCAVRDEYRSIDKAAVKTAAEEMTAYTAVTGRQPEEIIPGLLTKNVGHRLPLPDSLHITSIEQAAFVLRDRLFVTGLSAGNFPGMPSEDPLTLDSDLQLFDGAEVLPTSEERIKGRKKQAVHLAELASKLCERATLSYSYFDPAELKGANMSTALHDMYGEISGDKETGYEELLKTMPTVSYFDDEMTSDRLIGRGYCRNIICKADEKKPAERSVDCFDRKKEYSPSMVGSFFECPKRYFWERVLGIRADDTGTDSAVIQANEIGLLVHELMDLRAKSESGKPIGREEFRALAEKTFDRFLTSKIPLIDGMSGRAKNDLVEVALKAYDMDVGAGTVIAATEQEYSAEHSSGFRLKGRLDRLEKQGGDYVIADFKTGRTLKQSDSDSHTWLQTMLYAYMVNCQNAKDGDPGRVVRCEYRYPRIRAVSKDYDPAVPEEVIKTFTKHLTEGDFPYYETAKAEGVAMDSGDECKYCSYRGLCRKEKLL